MDYGKMESKIEEMWLEEEKKNPDKHIIEDLCKEYALTEGKTIQFRRYDPTFLPKA